jgi:hypothetical protein
VRRDIVLCQLDRRLRPAHGPLRIVGATMNTQPIILRLLHAFWYRNE